MTAAVTVKPIGSAALVAAVTDVDTIMASIPGPSTATLDELAGLTTALTAAETSAASSLTIANSNVTALGKPANFTSGTDPAVMAANVANLVAQTAALASVSHCADRLGQMGLFVNATTTGL